jgi:hypothetical protein
MLGPGTSYYWYRHREDEFFPCFSQEGPLVCCNNIPDLVHRLGPSEYDPSAWRLFIDTSNRSLQCVFLHNGNIFGSVPIAHSVLRKESYENLKTIGSSTGNTIGKFVAISKSYLCYCVNSLDTPNIHALCVSETVEHDLVIGS